MNFLFLSVAIVAEVVGTSALKASESFTKPMASVVTFVAYAIAFYFLALTLKTIPVGIAYAIWSGLGVVLISLVGIFWFRQALDIPALIGLTMIIGGVLVINLFSQSTAH